MGHRIHVYPHNDLLNLAFYHREVIENKVSKGDEDAIALDCMSCLIALAFSVEAIVNFVGSKKIPKWEERSSYKKKMESLGKTLGFIFDERAEPYKTLQVLKNIRNQMAHGKPIESTAMVSSRAALRLAMAAPWDEFLKPEIIFKAFEHVKTFEHQLLEKAGISLGETLTSGSGSRI